MQATHPQKPEIENSDNKRNYTGWGVVAFLTTLGTVAIVTVGPKYTEPSSRPTQSPAQQTVPQQLPVDSSALDSIVGGNSNIIFIPGAGGDSVEASIDSANGFPVMRVLSDSLTYNQFLRLYQK
mgnify:CR=1 FL=1